MKSDGSKFRTLAAIHAKITETLLLTADARDRGDDETVKRMLARMLFYSRALAKMADLKMADVAAFAAHICDGE